MVWMLANKMTQFSSRVVGSQSEDSEFQTQSMHVIRLLVMRSHLLCSNLKYQSCTSMSEDVITEVLDMIYLVTSTSADWSYRLISLVLYLSLTQVLNKK